MQGGLLKGYIGNIGIFPGFCSGFVFVFHVNFDDFLGSRRSLALKFGFYAKSHLQNRLEMSGRLQKPPKTSIFRVKKIKKYQCRKIFRAETLFNLLPGGGFGRPGGGFSIGNSSAMRYCYRY